MKRTSDMHEGTKAFDRFDALVGSVLKVPHSEIMRREEEYKKKAALNPKELTGKEEETRSEDF